MGWIDPTRSLNVDLMLEHYFGTIGLVSGGVFYKNIDDFIVNQRFANFTFQGTEYNSFTQPINGGNAPAPPPMTMFCGVRGLSHIV